MAKDNPLIDAVTLQQMISGLANQSQPAGLPQSTGFTPPTSAQGPGQLDPGNLMSMLMGLPQFQSPSGRAASGGAPGPGLLMNAHQGGNMPFQISAMPGIMNDIGAQIRAQVAERAGRRSDLSSGNFSILDQARGSGG